MRSKSLTKDITKDIIRVLETSENKAEPLSLHVMCRDMPELLNSDIFCLFVSTGLVRISDKKHNGGLPTLVFIVATGPRLSLRVCCEEC